MMRSLPHLAAAIVSVLIALLLAWIPYNLWLLIAAIIAMIAGGETDPARLIAALAAFLVGIKFSSVIGAVFAGMVTLCGMQFLIG